MAGYLNTPYMTAAYMTGGETMADRSKLIFVNTDGDYEESSSADSLQYTSFKTASYELTDSLLGDVVNKMIKSDGSRDFAANQSMGGFKLTNVSDGSADSDAVNYGQLVSMSSGLQDFRESVIDKDLLTPPGTPSEGDRYIVGQPGDTATDVWAGHEGEIAEYDGSAWTFESQPDEGTYCFVEDEDTAYIFNNNTFASGSWVAFNTGILTAHDMIAKSGNQLSVDLAATSGLESTNAGDAAGQLRVKLEATNPSLQIDGSNQLGAKLKSDGGILVDGSGLYLEVDDSSIEVDATNGLQVKALGIKDSHIDFGTGAGQVNDEDIPIVDSNANFDATMLNGALDELYQLAKEGTAIEYTASGAINKGDLVYLSGNNLVSSMPISASNRAIGVALASVADTEAVEVVAMDAIISGVLTSAVAGTRYYWDGSALTSTIPSASGSYVWQAGIAKNATDLISMVEFVKKNA